MYMYIIYFITYHITALVCSYVIQNTHYKIALYLINNHRILLYLYQKLWKKNGWNWVRAQL